MFNARPPPFIPFLKEIVLKVTLASPTKHQSFPPSSSRPITRMEPMVGWSVNVVCLLPACLLLRGSFKLKCHCTKHTSTRLYLPQQGSVRGQTCPSAASAIIPLPHLISPTTTQYNDMANKVAQTSKVLLTAMLWGGSRLDWTQQWLFLQNWQRGS
eukprot:TRINITY_DN67138_c3_g1_i1.p2 TRINITY_DN67138_c3_g1~~TRINITY_DN67138_c3_g1_i1.p2  ORF type:complete len:156 (-),score=24.27 TRINITY_DN67138_c3_g1_i1:214-681(-)